MLLKRRNIVKRLQRWSSVCRDFMAPRQPYAFDCHSGIVGIRIHPFSTQNTRKDSMYEEEMNLFNEELESLLGPSSSNQQQSQSPRTKASDSHHNHAQTRLFAENLEERQETQSLAWQQNETLLKQQRQLQTHPRDTSTWNPQMDSHESMRLTAAHDPATTCNTYNIDAMTGKTSLSSLYDDDGHQIAKKQREIYEKPAERIIEREMGKQNTSGSTVIHVHHHHHVHHYHYHHDT